MAELTRPIETDRGTCGRQWDAGQVSASIVVVADSKANQAWSTSSGSFLQRKLSGFRDNRRLTEGLLAGSSLHKKSSLWIGERRKERFRKTFSLSSLCGSAASRLDPTETWRDEHCCTRRYESMVEAEGEKLSSH
jgi:hypothetical protein